MTSLGRTLWAVILVKLFIMFAILRLFFFPDVMGKIRYRPGAERVYDGTIVEYKSLIL